ncbi:MAG: hypothetical protein QNJ13_05345 [Paracoccaceae bacterium]|nr:hypothetical protein [Paracoccaceae bacterium]
MKADLTYVCDQHPNRFDCPDNLISYDEITDSYGIIVHDGGSSVINIGFCPFCGTKLRDLSDLLFSELDRIDPDWEWETVPPKYRTAAWWRERGL